MNLFRTSTQRTRSFRIFAALVWGGGLATSPLFAGALSFTDAVERLNTTASTLRTEIFTTPGTLLLAAGDTLARANDALTARIAETLATVDTTAAAAIAATRDTISSSPQLALSLDALKTTLVCFFTTCTTQVPAPAPTPALSTSTTTPKAPTRTVTTSQPKPTTPASTSNLPPTTSNLSAPPLTVTTTQPEIVTKVIQTTVLGTTDETLDAKLATLRAELLAELSRVRQTTSNNYQAISISNRIDSLTDTRLINPTITGGSIAASSLSGAFSSGSFSSNLTVAGTGTSTFSGDSLFDTDTLVIDSLNNRIGIGTSSPSDTLAINGALYLAQISAPSVTTNRLYNQSGSLYWNGSALGAGGGAAGTFATTTSTVSGRLINYPLNATDILAIGASSTTTAPFWFDPNTTTGYISGNLGVGTTSPYAKLSVVGEVVASHFTATSTTATSTFGGGALFATGGGNVGIGTTSPYLKLSVEGKGVFSYDDVWGTSGLIVQNNTGIGAMMISSPQDTPATLRFGTDGVRRWGIRKTSSSENGSNTGADLQIESFDDNGDHYQFPIGIQRSTGNVIINPTASAVSPYARLDVRGAGSGTGQLLEIANSASTTLMRILDNGTGYFYGNLGIGTTSPYAKLSVVGNVVADAFMATSTTATSTFAGALGIGSTSPFAKFSVTGGAVLFDGNAGATPTSGGGTRFMWVPSKYALRAGGVASTRWDDANIGNYSTAFGYNSIASGVSSFAVGDANQATDSYAVALGVTSNATASGAFAAGNGSTASGVNSVALGRGGLASGLEATALGGRDSTASGDYSVSVGRYVQAAHQSAFAFGLGVDSSNKMTTTEASQFAVGFGGTVPQFVVNGATGRVGIGTTSPYAKLSVVGQVVADYFTATSTTATSTFAGGVTFDTLIAGNPGFAYDGSSRTVGIGATPAAVGKLKVNGAGFFTTESNAFSSGSAYTSLLLGDASPSAGGALFAFYDSSVTSRPLVGLSGYNSGSERGLYFGGGGWGASDANSLNFYTDSTYSSSSDNDGGALRMKIFPDGGMVIADNVNSLMNDGVLNLGQTASADIDIVFQDITTARYALGYDDSENSFKISGGDSLGTNDFLTILSSGNVGIGTTTPYAKLSVAGQVVADAFMATSTTATSTIVGGLAVDTSTLFVNPYTNRVGIGTTSPSGTFEVQSAGGGVVPLYVRAGDAVSNLQNWLNSSSNIVASIDYTGGINANILGTGYSVVGAQPFDFGYTTTADRFIVSKENNAASAGRALSSVLDYSYTGGSSNTAQSALNGFVYYQGNQNLTQSSATAGGGLTGGRYVIRLGSYATTGTPTISLATGASAGYADTSGGGAIPTITDFANFHAESLNSNQTTFGTTTGFWMRNPTLSISASAANVVGLRVDELTAGTNNYAIYTAGATKSYFGGLVGIGTTTPVSTLSVQGSLCVRDTGSCGTTAGTIYATTAAISDIDLAENYPTSDLTLSAGEIVAIDTTDSAPEAGVSRAAQGSTVLGIVSTAPGLLLGKEFADSVPVALSGRVPVKVSLAGGPIEKGDRITLSDIPGVGQKATTSTYTVGIALDSFNESSEKDEHGIGKVLVFVNLAYSRIDPVVADGSLLTTTSTTGSAQSVTGSAFWNFDDATGRLNFVTPLNLNNFDIVGVRAIRSATSQWSIDEAGKLVVGEVEAQKVTVGSSENPSGITLYDKNTGAPYCVVIESGAMKNIPGKCGEASSEGTAPSTPTETVEEDPIDEPEPAPTPIEVPIADDPVTEEPPIESSTPAAPVVEEVVVSGEAPQETSGEEPAQVQEATVVAE